MADKPSRALVVYGDGLAPSIQSSHSCLHALASKACCGFLSLPNAPPSESEDERALREFSFLLDALESYLNASKENVAGNVENQDMPAVPKISDRFMGMKAALLTINPSLKFFGDKLGLTALQFDDFVKDECVESSELLKLLGFQGGKTSETSPFDVVFVHIGTGKSMDSAIEMVNSLVGDVLQVAQPGSEIGSRLHLSVVMSYGEVPNSYDANASVLTYKDDENSNLRKLLPRQSYTMRGETPRENVRHHYPMVFVQWQDAVTRRDMVQKFSFEDIKEHGASLVIPADRFLHEIAFKLWKAPKYGA